MRTPRSTARALALGAAAICLWSACSGGAGSPRADAGADGPPGADGGSGRDAGGGADAGGAWDAAWPAGTYYTVDPDGDDQNPGTAELPFRTIGRGIAAAGPGDVVWVRPGRYPTNLLVEDKHGLPGQPITVIGAATAPDEYPILDGGDPDFSSDVDDPALRLRNSSWIVFERLRIENSTDSSVRLEASGYVVLRRLVLDYHSQGVHMSGRSHHVLVERCEAFQRFGARTWTDLKGSKWEGGAYVSFGGAGMNVIRYNHIHDCFNGILLDKGSRTGAFYDANLWIYRNRFERVVDDPYEPETYAWNNHFFHNTLVDTHRMLSLAPVFLGPVYAYGNVQLVAHDPTGEASSGRLNSAFKIELDTTFPANGAYLFNNSVDVSAAGVNGWGVDLLADEVHKLYHWNNAYRTEERLLTSAPDLVDADFDHDMAQGSLGYAEPHGFPDTEPGFADPSAEDFRVGAGAAVVGRSRAVTLEVGFASPLVIAAGAALGAYEAGAGDFRPMPEPVYAPPPGGEDPSFGDGNEPWPADVFGGWDPPCGPQLP